MRAVGRNRNNGRRVLIADDQEIVRRALRALLIGAGFQIVGEAASGPECLSRAEDAKPDVISIDLSLPGLELAALVGIAPVVVFTALASEDDRVAQALETGVAGVVSKHRAPEELVSEILATLGLGATSANGLTSREREVLELAGRGLTNAQITERLGLRMGTIRSHFRSALQKLGARSRTEAVAMLALRND